MEKDQNVIAIVYDFDKTLSPDNMQEDTIFREYGIDKDQFWTRAAELSRSKGYERTIGYLRLLLTDKPFVNDRQSRHPEVNRTGGSTKIVGCYFFNAFRRIGLNFNFPVTYAFE